MNTIPYQRALQRVADQRDVVIGLRDPNPLGATLLEEGYASKSFHIKAKSSVSGPTAGFVVVNPLFGKHGQAGAVKQQRAVEQALAHGAGQVALRLSDRRMSELQSLGLLKKVGELFFASYGGSEFRFSITRQADFPELPWVVCHESGEAVMALSNPLSVQSDLGPRSAVTADYDLFCLFPRLNHAVNQRPLNTVARLTGRQAPALGARAGAYLDALRQTGREEHVHMGNISFYGETIVNQLNGGIRSEGYRGGKLVHHNDESGNPYSPGQDFPLWFFLPGAPVRLVRDNAQLLALYRELKGQGYGVEVNPAFSFRHF